LTQAVGTGSVGSMPNLHGPVFEWNHERLSTREDMMLSAILTLCYIQTVTSRQVQNGNAKPTADDFSHAERVTLDLAGRLFPDLQVRVSP
jgi:hypothetical protein